MTGEHRALVVEDEHVLLAVLRVRPRPEDELDQVHVCGRGSGVLALQRWDEQEEKEGADILGCWGHGWAEKRSRAISDGVFL